MVLSCAEAHVTRVTELAREHELDIATLGLTGGDRLRINDDIDIAVAALREAFTQALPALLDAE